MKISHERVETLTEKYHQELDKNYGCILNLNHHDCQFDVKNIKDSVLFAQHFIQSILKLIKNIRSQKDVLSIHYQDRIAEIEELFTQIDNKIGKLSYNLCSRKFMNLNSFQNKLPSNFTSKEEASKDAISCKKYSEDDNTKCSDRVIYWDSSDTSSEKYFTSSQESEVQESKLDLNFNPNKNLIDQCKGARFNETNIHEETINLAHVGVAMNSCAKVLLKIHIAAERLCHTPNSYDFIELLYRSEFLKCMNTLFEEITTMSSNDKFKKSESIDSITFVRIPINPEAYMMRFTYFNKLLEYCIGVMSKTIDSGGWVYQTLKLLYFGASFLASPSKRKQAFRELMISDNTELMINIVRLHNHKLSDIFHYFINPRIEFHRKIYIKKQKNPEVDLELSLKNFLAGKPPCINKTTNGFSYTKKEDSMMIRIISPFRLHNFTSIEEAKQGKPFQKNKVQECPAILIHIHGGGFICQGSAQHQTYLRNWSNNNNMPVFMLEYTLSPESKYPGPQHECWEQYKWIITNIDTSCGLRPKKILLSGDSAGGNLCTSLTSLCIAQNFPKPTSIFLCYPALCISPTYFTPSRIYTFDDMLSVVLNHLLVQTSLRHYCPKPTDSALLSPLLTSSEILKEFPPTKIFTAGIDPLHADGVDFAKRLVNLGVHGVELEHNKLLPHGFLTFTIAPFIWQECRRASQGISDSITRVIQQNF
ncbi:unnamed protein product [Moneuplotes crassus]|uniref:Alpha/beta hydrolase fold-3 domain-containing protein n=1 Tax=Euplotes crassus TaxID=5936 RepID=A0AAD1X5R7_EUPCR|nr:unnamed protein product [Moneuplotes crassus]